MTTEKKAEREREKRLVKQREKWAEKLKREQNHYEQVLWQKLRGCQMGVNFRQQVALLPTKYVADFYCGLLKLDIEVDGGIHDRPEIREKDRRRDERLEELGIQVFRISTTGLRKQSLARTLYRIRDVIEQRTEELGGVIEA